MLTIRTPWALQASELRASHVTPAAAAARAGHAADIEWLPLPVPVGGGSVLAAALADGGLALLDTVHNLDVRPRRMRMLRYRAALHAAPAVGLGGRPAPRLAPPPPLATPGVLPHAWTLLLRVLLQRGLPESVFRELRALAGRSGLEVERVLERLEGEAWACLPRGSQAAWEALARASEAQEAGSLTQFLDSFADTEDDNPGAGPAVVGAAAGMSPALGSAVETSTSLGSPVASSRDAQAAVALGLAGRSGGRARLTGEMRTAIKNLGGAFKDMAKEMAAAGKTQARGQAGMGMRRGAGGSKDGWLRAGWSLNTTRRQPALLQPQLNRLPLHQLRLAGDRGGSSTSSTLRQLGMLPPLSGVSDGAEAPATRSAGYQSLMTVLQAAGAVRGVASVLTQTELAAYNAALSSHRTADRMAVAAHLTGDTEESAFWRRLPATLHWLSAAVRNGGGSGAPGNRHGPSNSGLASGSGGGASGEFVPLSVLAEAGSLLWSDLLERAEAGERSAWHEQMSRRIFENSEELQEKRVLEYVSLGDFQTAVGFLLASPPDRSTRYYRDALCTLGMAFACGLQATAAGSAGGGGAGEQQTLPGAAARVAESAAESAARTLFVQAAKVCAALSPPVFWKCLKSAASVFMPLSNSLI